MRVNFVMSYLRQLPRIPSNGKIAIRLAPPQRDFFLASARLPRDLGHLLHRAPVRNGKLEVRVGRASLDALILVATAAIPENPSSRAERELRASLNTFLGYLEKQSARFEEAEEPEA